MSATVLYMSVSLDGFIAGPNERAGNGLGDGGERLHEWLWDTDSTGARPSGPRATETCSSTASSRRNSHSPPASSTSSSSISSCVHLSTMTRIPRPTSLLGTTCES